MGDEPLPKIHFDGQEIDVFLDLTLAAEVASIEPVVDQVMSTAAEIGCAAGREFEVELAVREALANAVVHGAGEDPSQDVQIIVACDPQRGMLIVVRDPGPGFEPGRLPSPVRGQQLFASHGRGVYLINQLMDDVRYERNGAEIWMRKQ